MSLLTSWLLLTLTIMLTASLLPGVQVKGWYGGALVAALFGGLNVLVGWILFVAIGLGTLGLGFLLAFVTRWLVNAILLRIVDKLTDKLTVRSFGSAFLAAMVMSAVGTALEWVLGA